MNLVMRTRILSWQESICECGEEDIYMEILRREESWQQTLVNWSKAHHKEENAISQVFVCLMATLSLLFYNPTVISVTHLIVVAQASSSELVHACLIANFT